MIAEPYHFFRPNIIIFNIRSIMPLAYLHLESALCLGLLEAGPLNVIALIG